MKNSEKRKNSLRSMSEYRLTLNKIKLIENNDYFNWLEEFTKEYDFFSNEMFGKNLYDEEDFEKCPIDKQSYFKAGKLYVLYSLIDEYASQIKNHAVTLQD